VAEHDVTYRPRVPRETQRLLVAALIALGTIWVLARVRFADDAQPQNPVAPLLDQLGTRARLADIARDIADARARLATWLAPETVGGHAVLRLRGEIGLVHLADSAPENTRYPLLARDPATGLGVVRIPDRSLLAPPASWQPERGRPVYLLAASTRGNQVTASPVLIDLVSQADHAAWPGSIWMVRSQPALEPGTFLFTEAGALGGMVIDAGGANGIVPGATLTREADRLLAAPPGLPGTVGIDVAALTAALAAATGATSGVVVNVVDPRGPAARVVAVGDVISSVDGTPVRSTLEWQTRALRVNAGERMTLHVVRRGSGTDRQVTAVSPASLAAPGGLGLELRADRDGAEVTAVVRDSAAWRAGLRDGDRIRQFGEIATPSPAAIHRAYRDLPAGDSVVVGMTRAGRAQVLGLEKNAAGR
jgi:S1-C subfamily serine protease